MFSVYISKYLMEEISAIHPSSWHKTDKELPCPLSLSEETIHPTPSLKKSFRGGNQERQFVF